MQKVESDDTQLFVVFSGQEIFNDNAIPQQPKRSRPGKKHPACNISQKGCYQNSKMMFFEEITGKGKPLVVSSVQA